MKTKVSVYNITACMAALLMAGIFYSAQAQENSVPKIEMKEVAAQKAMVIKTTVPTSTIGQKMGELYGKLYGYLGSKNIQPTGVPFAVYYEFDPKGNTVFEVGVPVASAQEDGDIKLKEFPAMKVVSTLFVGPYEKIAPAYEALQKYIKEQKLETQSVSWEVYLTDPSKESDPNKYQTLIYFVIK